MNCAAVVPSASSPWEGDSVSRQGRVAVLAACLLAGFLATLSPLLPILALAAPVALLGALCFPELVFVLFLTAGVYKQDPRLAVLPVDVTLLLAAWLCMAILLRGTHGRVHLPPAAWLLLPLFAAMGLGLAQGAVAYGVEKATRFCTLTLLAVVASVTLLSEEKGLRRFLASLAFVTIALSVYAAHAPETTSEGRLTFQGSNPISMGRVAAVALAFGWLQFHYQRRAFERLAALGILGIASYCVLGAGSRGPVLSFLASLSIVSFISHRHHRRSPISIHLVFLVGILGALIVLLGTIPSLPLQRFLLLLSEDKGTSVLVRGLLFATAWKLMLTHPLGIGVGGFSRHAILDLRYPHNLFLEIGSELGWIPLAAILVLLLWSLKRMAAMLAAEYSWRAQFTAVIVLTTVMNSMVTGDLNDNRMLFAVVLLPFLYRRLQSSKEPSISPGVESRTAAGDREPWRR